MPGLALIAGILSLLVSFTDDPADTIFWSYNRPLPGASIAVIKDGTIVFERAYGLSNVEASEKATPTTNFRLASMTKQFTAMAIEILAEKKALSIDDPVSRYLPELAEVAPKVTLKHLLTHTSGLPEYDALLPKGDTNQIVDRDVLKLVAQQKLELVPGAHYHYNNTGYALLALVVERVSKLSYSEFLARNIFKPLSMTSSGAYPKGAAIPNRAYGYSCVSDQVTPSDQNRTTAVLGDGGIYSSTRDLAHWIDALDKSSLIDPKRLVDATSAHVQTEAPGVAYGYGWRISEQNGEKLVYHTGTTSGFKNALLWVPSKKLAVIVLTNRRQGDTLSLAKLLLDQYWNVQSTPAAPTPVPTVFPSGPEP